MPAASSGFVTSAADVVARAGDREHVRALGVQQRAVARPMPRVAPVTMQALPVRPRSTRYPRARLAS